MFYQQFQQPSSLRILRILDDIHSAIPLSDPNTLKSLGLRALLRDSQDIPT